MQNVLLQCECNSLQIQNEVQKCTCALPRYRKGHQYSAGTRIRHLKALRESPWKLLSGQIICNYTVCCWRTTSSNILIVDHNTVKGDLNVLIALFKLKVLNTGALMVLLFCA